MSLCPSLHLLSWKVSLPVAVGWNEINFKVPSNKPFHDSVILWHGRVTVECGITPDLCHKCLTVCSCEVGPCTLRAAVV